MCVSGSFLKRSLEILLNHDLCHFRGGRVKYLVILIFWQKDELFKCFAVDWIKEVMGRRSWIQRKPREITSDQDHKEDLEEPAQSIGSEFSC